MNVLGMIIDLYLGHSQMAMAMQRLPQELETPKCSAAEAMVRCMSSCQCVPATPHSAPVYILDREAVGLTARFGQRKGATDSDFQVLECTAASTPYSGEIIQRLGDQGWVSNFMR